MSHPFENPDAHYLVLRNHYGQYSLWPDYIELPQGWQVALEASSHAEALEYVRTHWHSLQAAVSVEVE
jgi:MbtH protein